MRRAQIGYAPTHPTHPPPLTPTTAATTNTSRAPSSVFARRSGEGQQGYEDEQDEGERGGPHRDDGQVRDGRPAVHAGHGGYPRAGRAALDGEGGDEHVRVERRHSTGATLWCDGRWRDKEDGTNDNDSDDGTVVV